MPAHTYYACDNSQGNKVYSALDSCRKEKGSKLLADHLGMNIRTGLQGNDGICLVLMEPFGHYSIAASVFCVREEGNICSHPFEVEGNGKT